jgi:hypothetical protein
LQPLSKLMTHVKHLQRLLQTILIGALIEAGWHGLTACCGITGYEITIFEGALLYICTANE